MYSTPVIINNFNRLTTTKKLCEDLTKLGYTQVVVLDNLSDYPPLLQWYQECPYRIVRLNRNMGELAIYDSDLINEWSQGSWIAYTDSDIQLNSMTPPDFILHLQRLGEKYGINKVGLALQIDDLPQDIDYRINVKNWETKYWANMLEPGVFAGEIDTTFCVIRVGLPAQYEALRVGGNYTARHIPWYTDFAKLSVEEKYYLDHSSYRSNYKRIYDTWRKENQSIN